MVHSIPLPTFLVIAPDGSKTPMAGGPLPSDITPGEFVFLDSGSVQWCVVADKQRFWNGTGYQMSYSVMPFDPGSMTEAELYELRRKTLQTFGWLL